MDCDTSRYRCFQQPRCSSIEDLHWDLSSDREVMLEALKTDGDAYYHGIGCLSDREVVLAAAAADGGMLLYISFAAENAEQDGDEPISMDQELMLAAVRGREPGRAIEYESGLVDRKVTSPLLSDHHCLHPQPFEFKSVLTAIGFCVLQVMLAAVANDACDSLRWARTMGATIEGDVSPWDDRDIMLVAAAQSVYALELGSERLLDDRDFMLAAAAQSRAEATRGVGRALRCASERLLADQTFVVEANNGKIVAA